MPTVLRHHGFAVMIYTQDHTPIHVHIFKGGAEVVINILTVAVRENNGMSSKDVRKAQQIVADNQKFLASEWERIGPIP